MKVDGRRDQNLAVPSLDLTQKSVSVARGGELRGSQMGGVRPAVGGDVGIAHARVDAGAEGDRSAPPKRNECGF